MSDLLDRLEGINTRNATASTHARNGQRIGAHQQRGAAMKYIAAIGVVLALVLSLSAFIRAGALECKLKGEALSPRCLLIGDLLSSPKPAKGPEGKAKKSASR
jgi:hypothetical protein